MVAALEVAGGGDNRVRDATQGSSYRFDLVQAHSLVPSHGTEFVHGPEMGLVGPVLEQTMDQYTACHMETRETEALIFSSGSNTLGPS